jgi:CRISPR-associated endonuclease/helicase Cas3
LNTAPIAHSARGETPAQTYADHIVAVRDGAVKRARSMVMFGAPDTARLIEVVDAAAMLHDLGKLDPDNQAGLRNGARLPWDHVDAGAAQLMRSRQVSAALLVRGHHSPGLPNIIAELNSRTGRGLRGRRWPDSDSHGAQIERTDRQLDEYLSLHATALALVMQARSTTSGRLAPGLQHRLALSCLVDADHADTARHYGQPVCPTSATRFVERLAALDRFVEGLAADGGDSERNRKRQAFYQACRSTALYPMTACEASVGMGKTTAVTAYLLRQAIEHGLRRLVIVAPMTTIISQTVAVLRAALTLPGEDPSAIVAEHHHKVEYEDGRARAMAQLWSAPVVVTTAVQFFETLGSCTPRKLRKLHALPGSAIFIDEAHAALPAPLWPQNWRWACELADGWSCRFVFASGSLVRFWQEPRIVGDAVRDLPEIMPGDLNSDVLVGERQRVRYTTIRERLNGVEPIIERAIAAPGPRLLIMNTVRGAGSLAQAMRTHGLDVLHISTALSPADRERIIERIRAKLLSRTGDWFLVATSCIEAGVDISLRTGFRERWSASSMIQTAGRVNRNSEYADGSQLIDFATTGLPQHPAAEIPARILADLFAAGSIDDPTLSPADLVTIALGRELDYHGQQGQALLRAERQGDYPKVDQLSQVIDADTVPIVVEPNLIGRLRAGETPSNRTITRNSVQIRRDRLERMPVEDLGADLWIWRGSYDPAFLGYLDGI